MRSALTAGFFLARAATLGRGSYGKVCLSVITETNQLVAVKVVAKARLKTKAHVRPFRLCNTVNSQ